MQPIKKEGQVSLSSSTSPFTLMQPHEAVLVEAVTPQSPLTWSHSYSKLISRKLQKGRGYTGSTAIAGNVGTTLHPGGEVFQSRGSQPSTESVLLNFYSWSSCQSGYNFWVSFSVVLCLVQSCSYSSCLTPFAAWMFCLPDPWFYLNSPAAKLSDPLPHYPEYVPRT